MSRARLGEYNGLDMVFRNGKREVLPTVRPLIWLGLVRTWSRSLTHVFPWWTPNETTVAYHVECFVQLG